MSASRKHKRRKRKSPKPVCIAAEISTAYEGFARTRTSWIDWFAFNREAVAQQSPGLPRSGYPGYQIVGTIPEGNPQFLSLAIPFQGMTIKSQTQGSVCDATLGFVT